MSGGLRGSIAPEGRGFNLRFLDSGLERVPVQIRSAQVQIRLAQVLTRMGQGLPRERT